MSNKLPRHPAPRREWLQRLDRFAADLNVVLLMFAIGLAVLNVTFVFSNRLLDRLPITHGVPADMAQVAPTPAAASRLDLP